MASERFRSNTSCIACVLNLNFINMFKDVQIKSNQPIEPSFFPSYIMLQMLCRELTAA